MAAAAGFSAVSVCWQIFNTHLPLPPTSTERLDTQTLSRAKLDIPVVKALAVEVWRPEFDPQTPMKAEGEH